MVTTDTTTEWQCPTCTQYTSGEACQYCCATAPVPAQMAGPRMPPSIKNPTLKRSVDDLVYGANDNSGKRQRLGPDWFCGRCGSGNAYFRSVCMKCKTIKPGLEHQPDGMDWVCLNCDNLNREYREECNKCTMSKATATSEEGAKKRPITDWICSNCSNNNYPHRIFCNKCKRSREEVMSEDAALSQNLISEGWKCYNCDNINLASKEECAKCRIDKTKGTDVKTAENRSDTQWKCTVCENVNYWYRIYCNKCDLPRTEIGEDIPNSGGAPQGYHQTRGPGRHAPPPPPSYGAHATAPGMYGGGEGGMMDSYGGLQQQQQQQSDGYGMGGGGGGSTDSIPRKQYTILHDEVDDTTSNWTCFNCDNENFPLRSACNKCHLPKAEALAPETKVERILFQDKEWICPECRNSNYHFRIHCNKCRGFRYRHKTNVGVGVSMLPQISYTYKDNQVYDYTTYSPTPTSKANQFNKDGRFIGVEPVVRKGEPTSSWICPKCSNINWPKRRKCNSCGVAKDDVQAEWVCHYCKNVNTPTSYQCNSCAAMRDT